MTQHIVWDWNGTLFHDIDAVVGATNEVFKPYGLPGLTADGFRAVYTRPIWLAYERMLGRALMEGEWEELDRGFHTSYFQLMAALRSRGRRRGLPQGLDGHPVAVLDGPARPPGPDDHLLRHRRPLHQGRRADRHDRR
ncbi:hypothetical protein [Nonomuraea dietziae]|uniref:HAD family hydrolase n=1 Tax=Nonomuraea dietziae TaxID=65515 RepID=UPI0031D6FD57